MKTLLAVVLICCSSMSLAADPRVKVVALESVTGRAKWSEHIVRRKTLSLVVDFDPPITAGEEFLLPLKIGRDGHTSASAGLYGKEPGRWATGIVSRIEGKDYLVVSAPGFEVESANVIFFRQAGYGGPTLESLAVDGRSLRIPKENLYGE